MSEGLLRHCGTHDWRSEPQHLHVCLQHDSAAAVHLQQLQQTALKDEELCALKNAHLLLEATERASAPLAASLLLCHSNVPAGCPPQEVRKGFAAVQQFLLALSRHRPAALLSLGLKAEGLKAVTPSHACGPQGC